MDAFSQLLNGFAVALTPINLHLVPDRHHARHRDRRAARVSAPRSPSRCCCRSPSRSSRPPPSSCSPASITAPCTAARPPRSCSTRRARAPPSSPRSRATRWRAAAAPARRSRPPPSARSSPAPSARSASPSWRRWWWISRCKFGPADYFSLMVLAFVTVSAVLGSSAVRGLTALFFGIWLGLIGVDLQTGQPRFTFGLPELLDGINVIVVAVGLFAVGETLLRRLALSLRQGRDHSALRLALDDARGMARARGSPGCAAPRSAFRSAPCRRAAPRFRPF